MALEIERKYLVTDLQLVPLRKGKRILQGYIAVSPSNEVRVRIKGDQAFLTIKNRNIGRTRNEFEYPIPSPEAKAMIQELCEVSVVKTRYTVEASGRVWEVDIFEEENEGLVLAEVELQTETDQVSLPQWVDQEVSEDARYYNANLARHPFKHWHE